MRSSIPSGTSHSASYKGLSFLPLTDITQAPVFPAWRAPPKAFLGSTEPTFCSGKGINLFWVPLFLTDPWNSRPQNSMGLTLEKEPQGMECDRRCWGNSKRGMGKRDVGLHGRSVPFSSWMHVAALISSSTCTSSF